MVSNKLRYGIITVWTVVALTAIAAVGMGAWWRHNVRSPIGHVEVEIGGVFGNELILYWNGRQYVQSSVEIPLHDHPFQRTTWGEWFAQHPDTQVYLGDT